MRDESKGLGFVELLHVNRDGKQRNVFQIMHYEYRAILVFKMLICGNVNFRP